MKRIFTLAGVATLTLGLAGHANAQGWAGECIDPANTSAYSTDYGVNFLANDLFSIVMGGTGTVAYGNTDDMNGISECFDASQTFDAVGGYAFGVGGEGSVQSDFDNEMALSFGWPADSLSQYSYTRIDVGEESFVFGEGGYNIFFSGLSKRYIIAGVQNDTLGVNVQLETKLIGDACRMRWRITNTGTESVSAGVRFGLSPYMASNVPDSQTGATIANTAFFGNLGGGRFRSPKLVDNYVGFTFLPNRRPLRTEYKRELLDSDFPDYVSFMFGQTEAYGLRMDNRPSPEVTPDATSASEIVIGNYGVVLASGGDYGMSNVLFGDPTGGTMKDNDIRLSNVGVIQTFPQRTINAGGQEDIVHYMRSAWSVANYADPYTVVLDAPRLVNYPGGGNNNQDPNPLNFRVWVDNQFATIDREVPLNNVRITMTLPDGLSFAPGETPVKLINTVAPNALVPVDFSVVSDGETFGDLPISVKVETLPGPTKTLETTVRVAAAPTMSFVAGPNMVTFPYSFGDSALDQILGLTSGVDYVAFQWNSELNGYQPVTSAQRGVGMWIVPNSTQASVQLQNAQAPADTAQGGLLVNLKQGWNLIGNPYNYAVQLSQLIGVAENNPADSLTWNEMVQNDFVTSALTYFDADPSLPGGGSYELLFGQDAQIEPHKAYWVFVRTAQPIRLIWPPLFQPGLPNSGRSVNSEWKQTDREWRLQLSARSSIGVDAQNYVGVVTDRNRAKQREVPKAPMAPGAKLELAILDDLGGQPTRMAQAVSDRMGKQTWKVQVKAEEAGEVTLTWPNLGSMPRGVRARITDDASGERKDLRATSGYTFRMDQPGTRVFTLTVEPGGSSKPVIGNVLVRPAGRDANSPVVVNYALSADALVTVRILSSTGKEVYTVTRGRSDSAGENSVTWTLRDNANRAVAPGTYRVEILAETPSGERVRKMVPVNVVR